MHQQETHDPAGPVGPAGPAATATDGGAGGDAPPPPPSTPACARLRWRLFAAAVGCLVGFVLATTALLNLTSFANVAFVSCLVLAHGCAGVLVGYVVNAIRLRGRAHERPKVLRWLVAAGVVGLVLWKLDTFVVGLVRHTSVERTILVVAVAAAVAGLVWELAVGVDDDVERLTAGMRGSIAAAARPVTAKARGRTGDPPRRSRSGRWRSMTGTVAAAGRAVWRWFGRRRRALRSLSRLVLLGAVCVPLGAIGPVLLTDYRSDERQATFDALSADEQDLPTITLPDGTDAYVALGDSYSAGEGVTPFLSSPEPACHRSTWAYARLLEFGDDADVAVEFRACSGAVTADVDRGAAGGFGPQLDRRPRDDVGLVTLTVGGNDVVFSTVVRQCFIVDDCHTAPFTTPEESPQRPDVKYPDVDEYPTFETWAAAAMTTEFLGGNLAKVYGSVRETYPRARRIVIGYPYLFADGEPTSWIDFDDCSVVSRRVEQDERESMRARIDDLNGVIADLAYRSELEFVSTQALWDGHEPCGRDDQWTNALRTDFSRLSDLAILNGASFHPNRRGQFELARLISAYLAKYPEPVTGPPPDGLPGTFCNPVVDDQPEESVARCEAGAE